MTISLTVQPRIQREKWSLYWKESMMTKTDILDPVEPHALQRVVDGAALGIEDAGFQADENADFHRRDLPFVGSGRMVGIERAYAVPSGEGQAVRRMGPRERPR